MTEENEQTKIYSETRGMFNVYTKDKKVFTWTFPISSSIEENYNYISYLTEQVEKTIEQKKKAAEEERKYQEVNASLKRESQEEVLPTGNSRETRKETKEEEPKKSERSKITNINCLP